LCGRSEGHHDLLVGVVQRVEGCGKNSSCVPSFALQELDVVDEQDIDVPVGALEGDLAVVPQGV